MNYWSEWISYIIQVCTDRVPGVINGPVPGEDSLI